MVMQAPENADENDIGSLGHAEFIALGEKRAGHPGQQHVSNLEQIFNRIDENGDGEVTQREAEAHLLERHQKHLT